MVGAERTATTAVVADIVHARTTTMTVTDRDR